MMVALSKQLGIIPDSHNMLKTRLGSIPSQVKNMARHLQHFECYLQRKLARKFFVVINPNF